MPLLLKEQGLGPSEDHWVPPQQQSYVILCGARNLCEHKLNLREWANASLPKKTQNELNKQWCAHQRTHMMHDENGMRNN